MELHSLLYDTVHTKFDVLTELDCLLFPSWSELFVQTRMFSRLAWHWSRNSGYFHARTHTILRGFARLKFVTSNWRCREFSYTNRIGQSPTFIHYSVTWSEINFVTRLHICPSLQLTCPFSGHASPSVWANTRYASHHVLVCACKHSDWWKFSSVSEYS